jgi:opacity protein-like surface antigen
MEASMRRFLFAAALLALMPSAANAAAWIAVCHGLDVQYAQTVGGTGYFHIGQGDGSYQTQRVSQSFYDGTTVCGAAVPNAPQVQEAIAQVCADKTKKTVSIIYKGEKKNPKLPDDAQLYCSATVTVH